MSTPTDLELMMYADGELDPARLAAIKAFLAHDAHARATLAALRFTGDIVREQAETSFFEAEGGIADRVMAKIAAGEGLEDANDEPAGAEVIPFRPKAATEARPGLAKASRRDSGRTIFMLAAAAVAAAAAMMLWARTEPPAPAEVATLAPPPLEPLPSAEMAEASLTPEGDMDVGVEVAAVDFGSGTGSIFYVPSDGAPGPMTTVVWVSDPAGDE